MKEIWIETGNVNNYNKTIVAVSNKGRIRTKDGEVRDSKYREQVTINGGQIRIYVFIANKFIQKTDEDIKLGRNTIDHITHNPTDMSINDVRNLRWCTQEENMGFEEAIKHNSESHIGLKYEPRSNFGKKFYEHYGLHCSDDNKLYDKEKSFYYRHNKRCSWE
jgi:hypothetical protein